MGMKKLKSTIKTKAEYDAFATAVDAYIELCRVEKRLPQFTKLWSTFVNNWKDYLTPNLAVSPVENNILSQLERVMKGEL